MSELRLNTDGHIIKFGADNDVSLTHVADTGLLLNSTMQLQFNDASQNINAPSATVLDINATDEIELNATLVDINANVEISGTATTTGVHTFSATPVFPDGSLALADLDIDGGTDIGAAIVDADLFIIDDGAGGTNRKTAASRLKTYIGGVTLSGSTNNTVATLTGANALIGEATMTYDATTLSIIPTGTQSNIRLQNSTTGSNASDGFLIQETGNDTYLVNYENAGMYFRTNNTDHMQITAGGAILIKQGIYAISDTNTGIQFDGSDLMTFHTNGDEQMRLTGSTQSISLNYAGTSVTGNVAVFVTGQAGAGIMGLYHKDAAGGTAIGFFDGNNQACGSISIDGNNNATAYNTSSDYRLKENVNYDFDATTELKKLKPAKFSWKSNSDSTVVEGFLAHEVSEIVPQAIQGTKDATETKQKVVLGKSGNFWRHNVEQSEWEELKNKTGQSDEMANSTWYAEKEIPIYQSIDQSKLVPLMVKTILELEARIKTLEDA